MAMSVHSSFRGLPEPDTVAARAAIQEQISSLEAGVCGLSNVRVVIECAPGSSSSGCYRVHIQVTVPPAKKLVAVLEPDEDDPHDEVVAAVRRAFGAMQHKIEQLGATAARSRGAGGASARSA